MCLVYYSSDAYLVRDCMNECMNRSSCCELFVVYFPGHHHPELLLFLIPSLWNAAPQDETHYLWLFSCRSCLFARHCSFSTGEDTPEIVWLCGGRPMFWYLAFSCFRSVNTLQPLQVISSLRMLHVALLPSVFFLKCFRAVLLLSLAASLSVILAGVSPSFCKLN